MAILSLSNISFSYDKTPVLSNVSFEFEKGKMYCIVGKSGAGKTTLLSLLSGLASPSGGEILYDNKNIAKIDKYKFRSKYIGVVFQSFNLITKYTALENVVLSMDVAGCKTKNKKQKALELLSSVGLDEDEAKRRVLKLSGGQQQRVAIARTLAMNPDVILLDEPISALDVTNREIMKAELKSLQKKFNATMLFITHDQEEAFFLSDRIMVMSEGNIEQVATPLELYKNPANDYINEFVVKQLDKKYQDLSRYTGRGKYEG